MLQGIYCFFAINNIGATSFANVCRSGQSLPSFVVGLVSLPCENTKQAHLELFVGLWVGNSWIFVAGLMVVDNWGRGWKRPEAWFNQSMANESSVTFAEIVISARMALSIESCLRFRRTNEGLCWTSHTICNCCPEISALNIRSSRTSTPKKIDNKN